MKKRIGIFIGILLLLAGIVWAADFSQTSGSKTASALIDSSPGLLDGFVVITDGTYPVTITLYDNTASSGTVLLPATVITTSAANRATMVSFDPPWRYSVGLYALASINASGTMSYVVSYRKY